MPVSFSVKNVPDRVAKALRARAKRNHRSLQGELLAVLEAAAQSPDTAAGAVRESGPAWPQPAAASVIVHPASAPLLSGIPVDRRRLAAVCRRHHVRRLSVFGSALRADFHETSDVDLLVEFDGSCAVGFRIFDVERDLSALFDGRRVDLVNPKYLNPRLAPGILSSAELLYAEE